MASHKVCSTCHRLKPVGAFHRDPSKRGGRRARCGECETAKRPSRSDYMRDYFSREGNTRERERRTCARCDAGLATGYRKRYCPPCRAVVSSEKRTMSRSGITWHGFKPEARTCEECTAPFMAHAPHAKFCSDLCRNRNRERSRPPRDEYGKAHRKLRARWAPAVATGTVACARCARLITPDEPWDLDHDDNDRSRYLGPSHARCNRATSAHRVERELATSRDW